MKNLKKLSRNELRNVNGGLMASVECPITTDYCCKTCSYGLKSCYCGANACSQAAAMC